MTTFPPQCSLIACIVLHMPSLGSVISSSNELQDVSVGAQSTCNSFIFSTFKLCDINAYLIKNDTMFHSRQIITETIPLQMKWRFKSYRFLHSPMCAHTKKTLQSHKSDFVSLVSCQCAKEWICKKSTTCLGGTSDHRLHSSLSTPTWWFIKNWKLGVFWTSFLFFQRNTYNGKYTSVRQFQDAGSLN